MKKYRWPFVLLLVFLVAPAAQTQVFKKKTDDEKAAKAEKTRHKIDEMAQETLDMLFEGNAQAKKLYDQSYGHAVFDNRKTSLLISSGGGKGIAVEHKNGDKTYMKMAALGLNLGVGLNFYQVVFLFEDEVAFTNFVEKGWEVGAGADATAGETGTSAKATATSTENAAVAAHKSAVFSEGIAVFQFTEKGLMLQADISGTKYWKHEKLNNN